MDDNRLYLAIFICLIWSNISFSQSPEKNYIQRTTLFDSLTNPYQISELEDWQKSEVIEYYDGLGRLAQSNQFHATPAQKDMIQHVEYDTFGLQRFSFLPFPSDADGNFLANGNSLTSNYYSSRSDNTIPFTTVPFGESEFDNSPLNRVMKQGFPGNSWQLDEHPQQFDFLSNTASDQVALFDYNEQTHQFNSNSYFEPDSLFVILTTDENENVSKIFKDKSGRIVLDEKILSGSKIRTYYIYNINGNLAVVIQPEGSALIGSSFSSTSQFIERWCFTYRYDNRNRIVEKRIPGMKLPVYMVYDSLDRLILTQDGNLRKSSLFEKQWYFTKYDALGRPILEGIYMNQEDTTREMMQSFADQYFSNASYFETRSGTDYNTLQGYTDNAFPPIAGCEILKVYYYDNYDFNNNDTADFSYQAWLPFVNSTYLNSPRGMLTGTKTKILIDPLLSDPFLTTIYFYDQKSRMIQQLSRNHFGHFDTLNTKYSFAGDVLMNRYVHTGDRESQVVTDSLVYDHARRLVGSFQKVNNQPMVQVSQLVYNEIGMLVEKNLHRTGGSGFLQSMDYSYNIRGWLTGINTRNNGNDSLDVFYQQLAYDSIISNINCTVNFNGNISANVWKHSGSTAAKGYVYSYDALNRLTQANYGHYSSGTWSVNQFFAVPLLEYDKNGNLTRLRRYYQNNQNYDMLDDLYYYYMGNQIAGVDDYVASYRGFQDNGHNYYASGRTEYTYDANGNLTGDLNKGIINIIYNHLNLPFKIELENKRRIYYFYDANGTKLRKYFYEDNRLIETTDYSGMFVYTDDHIDYINTSEGRLKRDDHDNLFYAEYFIKDHLGNVRDVITSNPNYSNPIIQATDYYPFGLEIQNIATSDNLQLYNSKELQTDAKLWWYDYGARFFDPQLGRWHSVDPMAEKYFEWSPYEYVGGNPILRIDPNGMDWDVTKDENGNTHFNVTVQVKNTAGIPQEEVESLMNSIKSSFESTFQGTSEDGTTFSSTLNIDWNGEDEESADFKIDFVNKVEGDGALDPFASGKTDEIGNMNTNRMQVKVGYSSVETGITGAHEIGHSGGLWDIRATEMNNGVDETGAPIQNNNLMIQNVVCQCPGSNRTISSSQLSRISSNYYNGYTDPTSRQRMPIKTTREVQINNDKPELKTR